MKALGIDIVSNDLCWVGIEGDASGGRLLFLAPSKLAFPKAGSCDFDNLIHLKGLVITKLSSGEFQTVGIVKAGADCKPLRVKCEFVIELACKELGIPYKLIAPQTIAAAEKRKIGDASGGTLESEFNQGEPVQPKYLARAAVCAWCALS